MSVTNWSTSNYMWLTSPISAIPLTMAGWWNDAGAGSGSNGTLCSLGHTVTANQFIALIVTSGGNASCNARDSATAGSIISSTTTITFNGTWHHFCVVCASSTSRTIYLDGGGSATDTASRNPSLNSFALGLRKTTTVLANIGASSQLAETSLWNVALTASEVASLAAGVSPLCVRPASLKFHTDCAGQKGVNILGTALTEVGTVNLAGGQPAIIDPEATGPQIVALPIPSLASMLARLRRP